MPIALNMFIERLRRGLSIHPEFSENLTDHDRSSIWNKNYLLAGALSYIKVFIRFDGQLRLIQIHLILSPVSKFLLSY